MADTETTGNGIETHGNQVFAELISGELASLRTAVADLAARVDHVDTGVHGIRQIIDEHMPLLKRWTDPGAAVRGFLGGRKQKTGTAGGT